MAVPASMEEVIQDCDKEHAPLEFHDVYAALLKARSAIGDIDEESARDAWGELVAFDLATEANNAEPWRTYFGPHGSGTYPNGDQAFFPEIRQIDSAVLDHWITRIGSVTHPVLRARYADLAWELARRIDGRKPDFNHAVVAIDSYLEAIDRRLMVEFHDQMQTACRALDLACSIRDKARIIRARDALLALHDRAVDGEGWWWRSFDRLIAERNADITDNDRERLVSSLERLAAAYSQIDDPASFDPFQLENTAERLLAFYNKKGHRDDVLRVHTMVAKAFEHVASLGNAMVASSHLQTAENAYRDARLSDDADRVRIARGAAIKQSRDEMQAFTFSTKISVEDIEKFLNSVIHDTPGNTLASIALNFLWSVDGMEEQVKRLAKHAPVQAFIPISIMAADHQAAQVGGIEDDLDGRVCQQAVQSLQFEALFLQESLRRAIEVHNLTPHHVTGFAGRSDLFDDLSFVHEGVTAWFSGDHTKAIFVLTPQIECGLRKLTADLGRPVTKAHARMAGREVSIGMGDILSDVAVKAALGEDLLLHFKVIYSDPRGLNLRNTVAHGLVGRDLIGSVVSERLVHSLLVLGLWKELADARKPKTT